MGSNLCLLGFYRLEPPPYGSVHVCWARVARQNYTVPKQKVQAKRIGGVIDELEFVINESDKVVTYVSSANSDSSDFGANKKRLEEIRKRAGIFGKMGENMNSADSASYSEKGYGPLGQLKAFYGLQSGGGFEDVLQE